MIQDIRAQLSGAVVHGLRDYAQSGKGPDNPVPEVVELIVDRVVPVVESIVARRTAELRDHTTPPHPRKD